MAILITIIVVAVLLVVGAVGWTGYSKRRLRASFGPEVQAVARDHESPREVDRELRRRKKEHDALQLRTITPQDQENYAAAWEQAQGEFLNDPALALAHAEQLVAAVLEARGYPGGETEEQLALLSVEYADSLADYRAAQQVSRRALGEPANISTEELRQAMLSYLTLFNELLTDSGETTTHVANSSVIPRSTDGLEANR
jgi:hypothetical protein